MSIAMMARQRRFHDPLYAFRPEEEARQLLAQKRARRSHQIQQWTLLSIGGLGLIAGLVWLTRPAEIRPVGASTDAFARDDGPGRMLGAGRSGSFDADAGDPRASGNGSVTSGSGRMIGPGKGGVPQEPERRAARPQSQSPWAADIDVVAGNEAALTSDRRSAVPAPAKGFRRCAREGSHCVIDGGRFRWGSRVIELADVEVPNPRLPTCQEEAILGARALARLASLLNEGSFVLSSQSLGKGKRGAERHIVMRDGVSIGTLLVDEGLARRAGARVPRWC